MRIVKKKIRFDRTKKILETFNNASILFTG